MRVAETDSARTLIEPLTRREGQMLVLLAEGYSRPEIATQLTLALTSVKFHIQHLYGKLGVNSKRQALVRAKELGLLTPGAGPAAQPARKHNLPMQVTRFFGREAEIAQLRNLLDDNRLVILTGSGGVGKTRLALRVAEEALTEFRDGVCFVDLAPLADPSLVARQAAFSFTLHDEPGRSSLETLIGYLSQRQVLLVLDNCEHLLEGCARMADNLLRACPALKILATSREPLGAHGEALFRVPSLPFPDPAQRLAPDRLDEFPSVRLFIDRARLVLPNYQMAAHNAAPVARICQRLDGIPLALELAAARLKLLTAEQVAGRLDDTLGLLTGGGRTALARHQTLQATIEWSYALLTAPERLLLQSLSVFAGGCTLAAAEAVCAGEGLAAGEMLNCLTALVDKSLVIANRQPGQDTRYRLLEMVRQFAAEKLASAAEPAALRTRHRDYYLAYIEANLHKLNTAEEIPWMAQVAADLDNLRLALDWSYRDDSELETRVRLVVAMNWLWSSWAEALEWDKRGVADCETHPAISARLYAALLGPAAHLLSNTDLPTAVIWAERAVEICRRLGPAGKAALMAALEDLWWTYFDILGNVEDGAAASAEAEAIFKELGAEAFSPAVHITWAARFAQDNCRLANALGNYAAAKTFAAESIRLFALVGSPNGIDPLISLGSACLNLEEYDQAREHFRTVIRELTSLGSYWGLNRKNSALRWLGLAELKAGRPDEALSYAEDALRLAVEISDEIIAANCLALFAAIAVRQTRLARAARLAGAAQALYAAQGRKPVEEFSLETLLPGWPNRPKPDDIAQAFAAGCAMPAKAALAYALDEVAE
ncbi:MAG: LuxR C-terminal-related transcriptional regulator [Anaerolineales bacterium]